MSALLDSHGRVADDLRVSLTDRCNLRCRYCMPAEGLETLPRDEVLSADEVVRLVRIAVRDLGVRSVRFTGGEPLLRKDLVEIVAGCAALDSRPELSLTTNAIGLASRAAALREAGLDRVNVSIDSLHAATYLELTRRPFLQRALDGVDAAARAGLGPVKINAVLLRGVNDAEAPALLGWALSRGHQLRFIEQMPLDPDHAWSRDDMVTAAEIRASLESEFELTVDEEPRGGAPAQLFRVVSRSDGATGTVGIIASITEPFCADCRRTRITADGSVRSCLFSTTETDLRSALRDGADDDAIASLWRRAMWPKPTGHGIDGEGIAVASRPMSAIGG